MRLVQTTCNKCGAQLDIDLDHLQAYCPYCGFKLLMDFAKLDRVLTEKEKTRRAVEHEEQETKRTQMTYDYESAKQERESKQKDKERTKSTLVGIVALLLMILLIFLPDKMFNSREDEHNQKVSYLQTLEVKIENAIKVNDFDTAILNANRIYLDDGWSTEETAAWDAKRAAYIEIITTKKLEFDRNNPDNVFMPTSSDSFDGKKYTEVVDQLKALGFTNITTQVAYEPATFFHKESTVEHILIGGKTDFTTEDFFRKDTPIIIYYYSK